MFAVLSKVCSILGNIAMLSEGRPGVDNVYSLKDGMGSPREGLACHSAMQI